ncbi:hypothetical protein BpHYR1_037004 [Brachionus plicatilis]|uniref:Uncharacterized protein n=1 Tax=Brachionus plicatilis TaxID=10195 RepID=A0A3M7SXQ0_BRAPC|nr:hypothetical protein BpHYR1_037004 [Brachionus plicatilis]
MIRQFDQKNISALMFMMNYLERCRVKVRISNGPRSSQFKKRMSNLWLVSALCKKLDTSEI